MINGSGGGGKSGGGGGGGSVRASSRKADPYKQNLRSNAVAEVIDVLCEGPIRGLVAEVDEGKAYRGKSIAFDDTPLMSPAGVDNFSGYDINIRTGTANQNPIGAHDSLQTIITYDPAVELVQSPGILREVDLPDADELRIVLYTPAFYGQKKRDGSFYNAIVIFKIYINDKLAIADGFCGQTTGPYQRIYSIPYVNINYTCPYTVKIVIDAGDDYYHYNQTYIHDRIYLSAIIGVTHERFCWPYVAHARTRVRAKQFGGQVPARAFEIYGYEECPMPNNYYPLITDEKRFDDDNPWDGETWKYEWTDNPAWCWLAMLTNERFGLGVPLDDLGILKWQLCKIARYCDGFLPDTTERRWTFNAVIQTQEEAYHMLNSMASAFLAYPIWASNEVLIMQDAPDDPDNPADVNPTHIANQANVAGGSFNYSGSAINARHTVARITWNDPDDFGRPAIAYYENVQGIKRYGWRPKDVVAMGCNSYSQAVRYGRWVIDTELNAGDVVTFVGDMSFGDCAPGCRFAVMDPHFADARFGGRLVSATSDESNTYLTLDAEVTLAVDTEYTVYFVMPMDSDSIPDERQDQSTQIVSETVLNSPQTTNTLTIALQSSLPEANAYWYISEPNLNPRYFTCIANEPQEGMQYKITGLYHDYSKYGRIYDDVIIPVAPESYVPSGIVAAPTNFTATEYSYESGNNWRPGVALAWSHIDDARVMYYQVDRKRLDADEEKTHWHNIGDTEDCSFNIEPCRAGNWSFRVRGMGVLNGEWAEIESFTVIGKTVDPPDVKNVRVRGGGTTFSTRALHLEWDTVIGEDYMPESRFLHYQVNVYDTDDNLKLIRRVQEEYVKINFSELNEHFSQALAQLKVSVVAVDIYRNKSENPTVITVTCALPPDVENLRVRGGGTTFSTRALHLAWRTVIGRGIPESRFLHYRIDIYDTDDNLKLTRTVTEEYVKITFSELNEHFGSALTQLKVSVVAVDIYHNESETPTVITVTCAVPPDVDNLRVKGGGTTFADRDCHLEWIDVVDSAAMLAGKFKRYRINIYDTDNNLRWTRFSTKNEYSFTRGMNLKAFGRLEREFKVGLVAVDIYGRISASETIITVSNPAPDMSTFTPTIKELTTGLRIVWKDWNDASDPDLKQFRIYCDTNNPPTTLVAKLAAHRDRYTFNDGIKSYASHYVQIVPWDEFGEGVGSVIAVSSGQDVDIDRPIKVASSGKIVAGEVAGARVEYSSSELAGYSDETTKEFEISSEDGKIKAGGGSVLIDATGITISQGGDKVNRINWISGASKVEGSDGNEYVCIQDHTSSEDESDKPITGANYEDYWAPTGKSGGPAWWDDGVEYHASGTEDVGMLYCYDYPKDEVVYTTLHTRGDYIGTNAETRIRARCAEGKTASVFLYVNDSYVKLYKEGSDPAKFQLSTNVELVAQGGLYVSGNADSYLTGGVSIGSRTNENPGIGDLWVQSGIHVGYQSYAAPGDGRVIAEGLIQTATKFVSTLATGNKPIDVTSTTVCTNLNADMVDGKHAGVANGLATLGAGGLVPTSQLGTGTADNTVFLRGDGTWQAVGAGTSFNDAEGDPAKIGTAADGTSSYAARRDHVHACDDATTSTKGLASFSSTYFDVSSGAVSIKAAGVPYGRIQNVSATDKILGRVSAGAGSIEEITCTAAGRALLDDASAADQRTTLGLGSANDVYHNAVFCGSTHPATMSNGGFSIKGSAGTWTFGYAFLGSAGTHIGTFGAYGSSDTLTRYYLGIYNTGELLSVTSAGLVGIGVTSPTYDLEIRCGGARNLGVQRQTTSDTGGNNLLLTAGSATVAATNKNGGSLRLRPGLCTGSGYGQVQIYGCLGPGSGSSTTDGTYQELLTCRENKIGFFAGTPAVQQVLAAYTSDAESSAYTTTGSGADIASKADLNALRTAYETLRAMCEDLRTKVLATTLLTS